MSKYKGNTEVQLARPKKSVFDLSHERRLSTRMGRLTPVLVEEAIPTDVFKGSSEILLRLAPLLAPIYDQIILYVHYFFVPNRLLWSQWEEMITGGRLGVGIDPTTAPIPPYFDIKNAYDEFPTAWIESSLADYMGVPVLPVTGVIADYQDRFIDAMPFAAFFKCWYDYYRDRNFDDDHTLLPLSSGEVTGAFAIPQLLTNRIRDYLKGYFTASLPFTQRGEEVLMPLAGTGTVSYLDQSLVKQTDGDPAAANLLIGTTAVDGAMAVEKTGSGANGVGGRIENIDSVSLDESSVSINDFRAAYSLQVWLERNAIGGSRYIESIQAHFGYKGQDSRLQRAEYIGGGRINVKISEVVSTAYSENEATDTIPLGNMGGHGVTYGNTNGFRYFVPEHGFIIGIASIMARDSYHQGLPRMFRRGTFLDYPWPTFAQLGEQQVDKAELYASAANLLEDSDGLLPLFGYQSRYADWKQRISSNHGAFHSTFLFWTLTRNFSSSPTLGSEFVRFDDTTQDRIFAVTGEDSFWLYVHNSVTVNRALPYYGAPNNLGFQ